MFTEERFYIILSFFEVNGVSNQCGYTTPDVNESMVKSQAIKMCQQYYVLADTFKLEKISFVTFGTITDTALITIRIDGKNISYDTNYNRGEKMINTITLNPSLDYIVKVNSFKVDSLNRMEEEQIYAGGKGINVSIVLTNLGVENKALGYVAGFTGDEIVRQVKNHGVDCDFVKLENGLSRINVKLKSDGETEINGSGPEVTEENLKVLFEKLSHLTKGDYLVLSGSIPGSVPDDIYEKIMSCLLDKGVEFIVDATKDLLLKVLKYKPFLIKPNHHELAEMFNVKLEGDEDIIKYGKKLQEMGAKNVLVSMAGDGAILLPENGEPVKREVPKGTLKNSVGAGDSQVAGFICGYLKNNDIYEAFKMGIATGSASAFSEELATKEEVYNLLEQM